MCAVPWGVLSTVGDIMINVGGYLEYRGGYHEYRGGYLEYRGDVQYRGGYHDARGGYHEYRGGKSLLFEYPSVLMISPHMYHDIPHGTQISKDGIPYGTEHVHHDIPQRY